MIPFYPLVAISSLCIGFGIFLRDSFRNRSQDQQNDTPEVEVVHQNETPAISNPQHAEHAETIDVFKTIIDAVKKLNFQQSEEFENVLEKFINFYSGKDYRNVVNTNPQISEFLKYKYF